MSRKLAKGGATFLGQSDATLNALSLAVPSSSPRTGQHRKPDRGRRPHWNGVDAGAKEAHDRLRTIQNKPDGMNGEAPPASSTRSSGAAFACASIITPFASVAMLEKLALLKIARCPSQRETKYDRALRRARKLRLRLGGDPTDDEYPDKPPRMRWTTYNRLLDKLRAADGVADERLDAVMGLL
jgi:hypothetical protein